VIRLEGRRIVLRDWRPDETDAMHRWLGNALVTRYLSWGARTRHDSARHLRECIDEQKKPHRTRFFLAIELKESGLVIGDAGFHWTSTAREGHVGYFVEPAFWGRGYATEAAAMLLAFAFDVCGATSMTASCDARNVASERVMQKLGMQRDEGRETPDRRAYVVKRDDPAPAAARRRTR
jgi:[ribosomal protein S5]-alanine N-acetyltransferase